VFPRRVVCIWWEYRYRACALVKPDHVCVGRGGEDTRQPQVVFKLSSLNPKR
jgi:hypothetical protein